jgi:hypothetical protein
MDRICKACKKNTTTRDDPQVCTPCFLAGWGRTADKPIPGKKSNYLQEPSEEAPLYVKGS